MNSSRVRVEWPIVYRVAMVNQSFACASCMQAPAHRALLGALPDNCGERKCAMLRMVFLWREAFEQIAEHAAHDGRHWLRQELLPRASLSVASCSGNTVRRSSSTLPSSTRA